MSGRRNSSSRDSRPRATSPRRHGTKRRPHTQSTSRCVSVILAAAWSTETTSPPVDRSAHPLDDQLAHERPLVSPGDAGRGVRRPLPLLHVAHSAEARRDRGPVDYLRRVEVVDVQLEPPVRRLRVELQLAHQWPRSVAPPLLVLAPGRTQWPRQDRQPPMEVLEDRDREDPPHGYDGRGHPQQPRGGESQVLRWDWRAQRHEAPPMLRKPPHEEGPLLVDAGPQQCTSGRHVYRGPRG